MPFFSNIDRFCEAGEAAHENTTERFGSPAKSLFTSAKILTLHKRIEITDDQGNVVYRAETKFPSLHDSTDIYDARGSIVARMEKKLFTLHERHTVSMYDGSDFELSNELFHLVKDVTNIEGLGWQLQGNIMGLNFELYDASGEIIAVIAQKMFSAHDKYCVHIYRPEYEKFVVAILITLQHMLRDREAAASASSSSSSND